MERCMARSAQVCPLYRTCVHNSVQADLNAEGGAKAARPAVSG
ncbi:hypothetical protein RHECNPAF_1360059 [Rhizobium etli CNPAF512]|nr:hypothetical protein RHECNPAF_1360059 [Rhizobium etli CNPAF512]